MPPTKCWSISHQAGENRSCSEPVSAFPFNKETFLNMQKLILVYFSVTSSVVWFFWLDKPLPLVISPEASFLSISMTINFILHVKMTKCSNVTACQKNISAAQKQWKMKPSVRNHTESWAVFSYELRTISRETFSHPHPVEILEGWCLGTASRRRTHQ